MRCYYRQLLWLTLISITGRSMAKDLIGAPVTTLYVPPNAEANDEILADQPLTVLKINEDVAISIEPPSETVAVSPNVVGPGAPIHLLIMDPQKLRSNGGEKLQLKALGLISGTEDGVSIEIKPSSEYAATKPSTLLFEKENYELLLEHNFKEKEVAIVKLAAAPPPEAKFTLIGPLSDRFTVTNQGEAIYLTANPCTNCSTPSTFTLLLVATHQGSHQYATLNFKQVNEEEFTFVGAPYSAIVEEETGVFKRAVKVMTKGSAGDVMYTLQDPNDLFSINPKSGILIVQHPEFLTLNTYGRKTNLVVVATDKKTSIKTVIDITLTPVAEGLKGFKFTKESYTFTVKTGETLIGVVRVADSGNHTLHYDIAEGGQGAIAIDDLGMLTYRGKPEKDSRNFTTLVSAQTTQGQFLVATAWVDIAVEGINSNPVIVVGPTKRADVLSASAKRGTSVATIEMTDDDEDAALQLSIESISGLYLNGSEANHLSLEMFKINTNGRKAEVLLNEPIFDLPLASLSIRMQAQDHAHPAEPSVLVIQQLTITRKHPLIVQEAVPFKLIEIPEVIHIPAESPVGTLVYTARLLRSVISNETNYDYELDSSFGAFRIDKITGDITTVRPLHDLTEDVLIVTAHSHTEEQSAQANFTVIFTPAQVQKTSFVKGHYQGTVAQSDPLDTTVLVVEAKTDHGERVKKYSLEGVDADFFNIDSKGVIRLKESLAKISKPSMSFATIAGEGMAKSSVPVHVLIKKEENEEISFEKNSYDIKIMENVPLNGYVLHPQLISNNVNGVAFSLNSLNDATAVMKLLDIDETGRITVKDELLGYVGAYEFQVRAIKGDHQTYADVTMHVLPAYRCVPSFVGNENLEFSIDENMPPGSVIGSVLATKLNDKCELKYLLWDPLSHKYTNETSIASIDTVTGEIRSRKSFDYEKQAMFPLILGLQAGASQFAQMPSTIRVVDNDDHPLKAVLENLTVEVPEDAVMGAVIATMSAIDGDESQNIYYHLQEPSKEFSLNSSTGEVVLTSSLDRETKDSYILKIGASNAENAETEDIEVWMTLNVIVTDVNDNGPLFEESRYFILLEKNALPGEEVLTVHASDPDQPMPGNDVQEVFYRIKEMLFDYRGMNRAVESMFSIGKTTGIIQLEQEVSEYVGGAFHLLLESMDSLDENAHRDQCIVKVYIHDESDVVRMELPIPPAAVTYEKISTMRDTISNATGLKAMIKDLRYHHEEGNLIYDMTDLRLVLVNRTTSEIIPAERAIAIADKRRSVMGDNIPNMTKAQVTSSPVIHQSIPPVAYVLCTFAMLLTIVFLIFAFMMCHYRNRFQREKKLREDDASIVNALNRPPIRPMKISPLIPTRALYEPHLPAIESNYAVQEMKMVVAGEDDRRRNPW
ncbi:unnamed protein product [Cylicocyclus nassatus]|uniref:Cadherin domain-containing protein n=1 Tax=Cylicocyclus nassatus TaxID=53992 RepID=A0AA36HCE0_CYLNA|nr:unnamed protein product [Cylicocyclus nassatus]